jgi:hypothetical protein
MDNQYLKNLSTKEVRQAAQNYEYLINEFKATLEDYEMFVVCQQELVLRRLARKDKRLSLFLSS